MKMYVKPSISVIELQLKENIAAVPTTVYRGKKGNFTSSIDNEKKLSFANSGLATTDEWKDQYGISIL